MDNISRQYNNFHETYTENVHGNASSNIPFYQSFDFELKGKKILDIGCGDGSELDYFSNHGAVIHGIDPSSEFVKKAKQDNPSGIFVEGVGELLPFDDDSFDIVTSKWAIQTSEDVSKILKEISRVLRKGGMLVYLSKHPIHQFLEKIRDNGHGANYYDKKVVASNIYDGKITLREPTHTISEYFNQKFFLEFEMLKYFEGSDFPASEQMNGDTYPTYFIVVAKKK